MNKSVEIGLFCGTFNPIHNAHLLLAQCASEQFGLTHVYFITSPRPPHRDDVKLPGDKRYEMVSLAVSGNDLFTASAVELERTGLSYTVDTIKYFAEHLPDKHINLILGADNIIHLPTWHKFEQIIKSCRLLIAPRRMRQELNADMFTTEELAILSHADYAVIDFPLLDISSSRIRQRIKEGKSVRYMVPDPVWQSIVKNSFYK